MKSFQIDKNTQIICEWVKTRNAFKHTAKLLVNDILHAETKICYSNRTYESFQFESIIKKLLNETKILTPTKRKNFLNKISGNEKKELDSHFKTIGAIASLGAIFHKDNQKAQNDWKARMIKAGLGEQGLIMPKDWETLSEDTKTTRLNNIIKHLTN